MKKCGRTPYSMLPLVQKPYCVLRNYAENRESKRQRSPTDRQPLKLWRLSAWFRLQSHLPITPRTGSSLRPQTVQPSGGQGANPPGAKGTYPFWVASSLAANLSPEQCKPAKTESRRQRSIGSIREALQIRNFHTTLNILMSPGPSRIRLERS